MKKSLLFIMLAVASSAFAQKPFKMQGKIDGEKITTNYYIQVGKAGNYGEYEPEEVIEVKNSKFTYTKQLTEIVPATIKKGEGDDVSFVSIYLVPGENLKLTIKGEEFFYDGTPIYKGCNAADEAITPLMQDLTNYYKSALKSLEGKTEEQQESMAKGLQDTLSMKSKAFNEGVEKYKNENLNNEGALLFLSDYVDIETLYKEISSNDAIVNGRVGKFIKTRIDYIAKVQEMQAKRQAEEQAKLDAMNGAPAKDFILNDINGNPLSLSTLRGKYVILDFWGSWCGWCIKGIPDMKKYYEKYAGKFEILGVDCNDTEEKWKAAVEKYELPWLHVYNPRNSSVLEDYTVTGFPTKIVIDPQGNIAKIIVGEDPAFYTYLDEIFSK